MSAIDRAIEALEAKLQSNYRGDEYDHGWSDAIEFVRALPSIGEEPAREEVTLEWSAGRSWQPNRVGLTHSAQGRGWEIIEWSDRRFRVRMAGEPIIAGPYSTLDEAKQVCQRLQNVLDGAPVGQVLTREVLDGLDVATSYSNFQSAYWNWLRGKEALRDALLAKFGAAPQVRECPGHIHERVPEMDEVTDEPDQSWILCDFCSRCGAALEGTKE